MSIESPESNNPPQKSKSEAVEGETRSLNIFRKKIMRALFLGSYLALFEACKPTRDEIDEMPLATIESINENQESYAELPMIKTSGYIEDLGESRARVKIDGNNRIKITH